MTWSRDDVKDNRKYVDVKFKSSSQQIILDNKLMTLRECVAERRHQVEQKGASESVLSLHSTLAAAEDTVSDRGKFTSEILQTSTPTRAASIEH